MEPVQAIIQKIDDVLKDTKAAFDAQYFELIRTKQGSEKGDQITYSHPGKLTQKCIACNKDVVDYAIIGRWIEDETEGNVTISWRCNACNKTHVYRGLRRVVIDKLLHLSYR